jgi:RNA polymerase sigma factor (TIGR02999 family)
MKRMPASEEVTRLLFEWNNGNQAAIDALIPIVYSELHRLAAGYLRDERAAVTLQPTVLVHDAYIRLVSQDMPDWESRSHFFGVAARLMRQILVDHARKHKSEKRGGGAAKVAIEDALSFAPQRSAATIALDDALTELAKIDERQARVIELRFFGGLSVEETARALGVSVATIGRDQRMAEAWLHRELEGDHSG